MQLRRILIVSLAIQSVILAIVLTIITIFNIKPPEIGWLNKNEELSTSNSAKQIPAYVITLKGQDQRVPYVIDLFEKYADLHLRPYYAVDGRTSYMKKNDLLQSNKTSPLKAGEHGLRETMKNLFTMAYQSNYTAIFSFEDDAIPHKNFSELFQKMPERCRQADVILLGASLWHRRRSQWPKGDCFDADHKTFGSHALLTKRSAFSAVLTWLDEGPQLPFDVMYTHLQKQGFTVRVAYPPFLVIADVTHSSTIDQNRLKSLSDPNYRAARHDWHLEDYPIISFSQLFTSKMKHMKLHE